MKESIEILHVTPHLGGGVGKALLTLATASSNAQSRYRHRFFLLEPPEKMQFVDTIRSMGCTVDVVVDPKEADAQLAAADLVQLE